MTTTTEDTTKQIRGINLGIPGTSATQVLKYCPYCAFYDKPEATTQIAVQVGFNNVDYTCMDCGARYYHAMVAGEEAIFRYVPEASLLRFPSYQTYHKKEGYEMLYERAIAEAWFKRVDLSEAHMKYGFWTMTIEASAQLVSKAKEGHGVPYSIGVHLRDETEIPLDAEQLVRAIQFLQENHYVLNNVRPVQREHDPRQEGG